MAKEKQCMTCGGTGWQWLQNSWYAGDVRKERCHICSGTGKSDHHETDSKFVRNQRELRASHQAT